MLWYIVKLLVLLPLIGGETKFQPAYVVDVAEAFVLAAEGKLRVGKIYELGGPQVETHRQLIERVQREALRNRPLLPLSFGMARMLAGVMSILPVPPLLTADQVELLSVDNVVSEAAIKEKRTFAGMGIAPTSMDTILPTYLWRFRKHGQFDKATTSPVNDVAA